MKRAKPKSRRRPARSSPRALLIGLIAGALGLVLLASGSAYAMRQENHDAFCASCHTQPESQYYQQSLAPDAATLAALHAQKNVRCIDCHSGGGALGRVEGLTQGAQDLAAFYSGHYHNPAITQNKLSDDSCLKCHNQVDTSGGFDNHFHRLLARWQSVDPRAAGCVDCHTAHPAGNSAQGYLSIAPVQDTCQRCHQVLREGG